MSYTEIYSIDFDKREINLQEEIQNSHGFYSFIWRLMAKRFLNIEISLLDLGPDSEFWDLTNDSDKYPDIPSELVLVQAMTYDKCYVKNSDFKEMARCIDYFLEYFDIPEDRVNHLPQIRDLLKESEYQAICFNMSVNGLPYHDWNEEQEEYESDFTGLWDLFEEYKRVNN